MKVWDLAAGLLIVREAGGLAEPIREGRSILEDGEIVAGNAQVFDAFAKVIRNV